MRPGAEEAGATGGVGFQRPGRAAWRAFAGYHHPRFRPGRQFRRIRRPAAVVRGHQHIHIDRGQAPAPAPDPPLPGRRSRVANGPRGAAAAPGCGRFRCPPDRVPADAAPPSPPRRPTSRSPAATIRVGIRRRRSTSIVARTPGVALSAKVGVSVTWPTAKRSSRAGKPLK